MPPLLQFFQNVAGAHHQPPGREAGHSEQYGKLQYRAGDQTANHEPCQRKHHQHDPQLKLDLIEGTGCDCNTSSLAGYTLLWHGYTTVIELYTL